MALKRKSNAIGTGKTLTGRARYYQPQKDHADGPPAATPKPKRRARRFLASFLLMVLAVFLFIGTWDAINISRAAKKTFGSGNLFSLLGSGSLKGSETGRVNILLIGYSIDDPGHPAAYLTDSMMLLSLSTVSNTGYILSVPRDLYVQIPGFGYGKINEAYNDGNQIEFSEEGYAPGGVGLLEKIVAENFDIHIDYYALFNYAAVRNIVNALDGIQVNIKSPDPRGLYDPNISPVDGGPLRLANGPQTIDGQTALNLTRARGDAYGAYGFPQADFDRTEHQRQVLMSIKSELDWKLVLNPLKNGRIFSAVGDNVKTDLELSEARSLFGLFNKVSGSNLKSLSLRSLDGKNYLVGYTTPSGLSALIPAAGIDDYSQIQAAIEGLDQ